jgi:hypothetical protein
MMMGTVVFHIAGVARQKSYGNRTCRRDDKAIKSFVGLAKKIEREVGSQIYPFSGRAFVFSLF